MGIIFSSVIFFLNTYLSLNPLCNGITLALWYFQDNWDGARVPECLSMHWCEGGGIGIVIYFPEILLLVLLSYWLCMIRNFFTTLQESICVIISWHASILDLKITIFSELIFSMLYICSNVLHNMDRIYWLFLIPVWKINMQAPSDASILLGRLIGRSWKIQKFCLHQTYSHRTSMKELCICGGVVFLLVKIYIHWQILMFYTNLMV